MELDMIEYVENLRQQLNVSVETMENLLCKFFKVSRGYKTEVGYLLEASKYTTDEAVENVVKKSILPLSNYNDLSCMVHT